MFEKRAELFKKAIAIGDEDAARTIAKSMNKVDLEGWNCFLKNLGGEADSQLSEKIDSKIVWLRNYINKKLKGN